MMSAIRKKIVERATLCSILSRHAVLTFLLVSVVSSVTAADRYTDKQLEAFATRVGQTFWIASVDNRTPTFLSAPAPNASSFRAPADESFDITEMVGWKARNPYYKVRFDSGKEGYIRPEAFHEEFNLTILTVDPKADEKKKAARAAEENKQRIEWIQAQPWSPAVKEAAINRRPVPGMNRTEVQKVLGDPIHVSKARGAQGAKPGGQNMADERWFYANGTELVFHNSLLIRVESKEKKEPGFSTEVH